MYGSSQIECAPTSIDIVAFSKQLNLCNNRRSKQVKNHEVFSEKKSAKIIYF